MKNKKILSFLLSLVLFIGLFEFASISSNANSTNLPIGFIDTNIGNDESIGNGSFDNENKKFTIIGSGKAISKDVGVSDSYHFTNFKVSGNFSIVAKLDNFDFSNAPYGQAGLFIRENLTAVDSNYFGLYVEPSKNQFRYAFRDYSNEQKSGAAGISGFTADQKGLYIKLVRNETHFKCYLSTDNVFTEDEAKGQYVNIQSEDVYVGFGVSNGQLNKSSIVNFSDVVIEKDGIELFNSNTATLPDNSVEDVSSLPTNFIKTNIGENSEGGNTEYNKDLGQFILTGSGLDIAKGEGKFDSYHFVSYPVTGDFTVTSRFANFDFSSASKSKAGLIVRDNLTSNISNYYGIIFDAEKNEVRNSYRDFAISPIKSGASAIYANLIGMPQDLYVKIVKVGNKFTYYVSLNKDFPAESTYTKNRTVTMTSDTVYLGFGISNGTKNLGNAEATFDNVKIEQNGTILFDSNESITIEPELPPVEEPATPPSAVEDLESSITLDAVNLTWSKVETATKYIIKRSTTLDGEFTNLAELDADTLSYTDNSVLKGQAYFYKIVAINDIGEGEASNIIEVILPTEETKLTISFEDLNGQSISNLAPSMNLVAKTEISSTENIEATLIIALYDENNSMIQMSNVSAITKANDTRILSTGFTLPENIEGCVVKSFIWNSLDGLTPLSNVSILK